MRTAMCLAALVQQLSTNCGDMYEACRAVGVSLLFVNSWRSDDKEVDERLSEAERVGLQGLASIALQRAAHGHNEDVYYQGDVVGTKVVHHDGLLIKVLAAKIPEYAKGEGGGIGTTVNVNVAQIMPRAGSFDEWLDMKRRTLEDREDDRVAALPAPRNVEVLEHGEVNPAAHAAEFLMRSPFEGVGL